MINLILHVYVFGNRIMEPVVDSVLEFENSNRIKKHKSFFSGLNFRDNFYFLLLEMNG